MQAYMMKPETSLKLKSVVRDKLVLKRQERDGAQGEQVVVKQSYLSSRDGERASEQTLCEDHSRADAFCFFDVN